MATLKNKEVKPPVDEFVDADGGIISGDRNATSNSEIETGPVQKPFNDDSEYEKGMATTTDRAARYRQDIPWFAVYSYGQRARVNENEPKKVTKKQIEKKIEEDLVKKSGIDREVWAKDYNGKAEKVIDIIEDGDLTKDQLEKIKKLVLDKIQKKDA